MIKLNIILNGNKYNTIADVLAITNAENVFGVTTNGSTLGKVFESLNVTTNSDLMLAFHSIYNEIETINVIEYNMRNKKLKRLAKNAIKVEDAICKHIGIDIEDVSELVNNRLSENVLHKFQSIQYAY